MVLRADGDDHLESGEAVWLRLPSRPSEFGRGGGADACEALSDLGRKFAGEGAEIEGGDDRGESEVGVAKL